MTAAALSAEVLELLRQGRPPRDHRILHSMTVGREIIADFLVKEYLDDFIYSGGSKVKFLASRAGTGKTHLLCLLLHAALDRGYLAVHLEAEDFKLHQFDNLYRMVAAGINLEQVIQRYVAAVIGRMGYDPAAVTAGRNFVDWVTQPPQGRPLATVVRALQEHLEDDLYHNQRVHRAFAGVVMYLAADVLGVRSLEADIRKQLYTWLGGDLKKMGELRKYHIFTRIDRFNARLMLRSLVAVARLAGYAGLFVAVDGLEVLRRRRSTRRPLYTKAARDEFYESLRQLIDDFDGLEYTFFCFALRTELVQDEKLGFKSYEALWSRIHDEVAGEGMTGKRVNRFSDLLDLDRINAEHLVARHYEELWSRLGDLLEAAGLVAEAGAPVAGLPDPAAESLRGVVVEIVRSYNGGGDDE